MEMLASKLNPFGSFSKTSKASVSKPSYTYEQPNSSNKENVVDSIRKEKNQPRAEENTYQSRARSLERRNLSNTQPSFNYNRTESSSSQTLAAQFGNFFNSPKNIEGDFFKNQTQEKDSYRAKHLSRGLKSSFTKQDEKTSQSASSDHYLQSKIDQIINSSLSIKERSSKNTASSSKQIHSSNNFEEKSSEKLTLYTRLLNDMRTATPKSNKDHANQDQHYGSSASKSNSLASSEYYKGSDQAKKPYLDLKLSSVDFDTNIPVNAATSTNANTKLKEEVKALRSSQRLSFSQKRSDKSEENIKPERVEQQQKESVKKGDYPKQERLSLSRTLTVNTQSNTVEPHIPKYPVTMKNSRGGLRYNDNQSIYESLTNLKRSLERPLSNSIKNNSINGPSENNLSNIESKETKAIYKSSTPKANTASSSEVKNILQSFRNVLQRENKHQAGDEKQNTSINKKTLDDETYQNYLKEGAQRAEEKANLGSSMSSQQRPPSASKSSKYRESSLNLNRRSEDKLSISNSSQNYEKEKPQQKSLKDFITQVNPADNILASKAKMDIQKSEPQSYSNIQVQPQSAKNNSRPLLNERHMAAPGATVNIAKTSSTTTNSSVAQESRSFTFNNSLINKHSSRAGGNPTAEERNNAAVAKKEVQKVAAVICQYYMAGIEKYLKSNSASYEGDYFAKIYREHFLQGYQAINFCKYLKPVDPTVLAQKKVYLPKKESHKDKKTIIFDLDETLIHCNENANIPSDVVLPIRFPHGDIIEAGINVRPYAIEALEELSKHFEIVVFTASHSCYANVVLDYLDPQNKYIHHRLFRESCVTTEEGLYVKDLRIFANRNLKDLVIVDNAMYSFGYQFENGIPIIPFYYHKNDKELKTLVPYLKSLYHVRDVREVNIRSFKLHSFCDYDSHDELLKKLFE